METVWAAAESSASGNGPSTKFEDEKKTLSGVTVLGVCMVVAGLRALTSTIQHASLSGMVGTLGPSQGPETEPTDYSGRPIAQIVLAMKDGPVWDGIPDPGWNVVVSPRPSSISRKRHIDAWKLKRQQKQQQNRQKRISKKERRNRTDNTPEPTDNPMDDLPHHEKGTPPSSSHPSSSLPQAATPQAATPQAATPQAATPQAATLSPRDQEELVEDILEDEKEREEKQEGLGVLEDIAIAATVVAGLTTGLTVGYLYKKGIFRDCRAKLEGWKPMESVDTDGNNEPVAVLDSAV